MIIDPVRTGHEDVHPPLHPARPIDGVADVLPGRVVEVGLVAAFEELEDPCRRLLTALYLEDPAPSYQEIARRLGRPIGSLGPTRGRCLDRLRRIMDTNAARRGKA